MTRLWGLLRRAAPGPVYSVAPAAPETVALGEWRLPGQFLAESVPEGLIHVDTTGLICVANGVAANLLQVRESGLSSPALTGQTILEATHSRALADLCERARDQQTQVEAEVRLVGGSENLVAARAIPIPADTGGGVLLILHDQTEVSRLRTVRTEFVANVSHELRTPLASIRATAETLLDGALRDPEYGSRFLQTIIREADRLVRLSEDLLELSRAESSGLNTVRFDLGELLAEISSRLAGHAERRKVKLVFPIPAAPYFIEGDPSGMDQVFFNLVENAVKYTPEGGKVTVALTPMGVDAASVAVSDSGIGILSQDLPRIFERFWRADRARKFQGGGAATGGTGLGLSIVKHIVEAHGGVVTAESELGQGSTFTVTLPLSSGDST